MDPSGAIHTTALLERTRVRTQSLSAYVHTVAFPIRLNPYKRKKIRMFSEVTIDYT